MGCKEESNNPEPLVHYSAGVEICVKQRFDAELESSKLTEKLDRMSSEEGWIDLTITNRRKNEEICSKYASCVTENKATMSLIFEKCISEIENN